MTDNFDSIKERNSIKNHISAGIHYFIDQNKEKIYKSFSCISEDTEFFLFLLKDIYVCLKNNTELFNYLSITQIKEIPPIIYRIAKETFSIQRFVYVEDDFLRKIKNLYGFIYLATNKASYNKKVYIGQTIRTIELEWDEILSHGITLRKKREESPSFIIQARYILNAIAKYPDDVWDLKLIDIAFSKSELDNKERYYIIEIYDSMNPEKGYNLTTGGRTGGRLSTSN